MNHPCSNLIDRTSWVNETKLDDIEILTRKLIATGLAEVRIDGRTWPVYLPSGSKQYPAFWTRDAVWIAQSGLLNTNEIWSMLYVMAAAQQGDQPRQLQHGLVVPAWSAADHIALSDGSATFFPGTYSTTDDQGDGSFGWYAAQDANYQFIEMAWLFTQAVGDTKALENPVRDRPLIERLSHAFFAAEFDEQTQLAKTTEKTRAVAFSDAIKKTGYLLEGSVLRWRSARRLAALWKALGDTDASNKYARIAETIEAHMVPTFFEPTDDGQGWLVSATENGRQCCVRGTCFALAFGAVRGETAMTLASTLKASATPGAFDAQPQPGQITYQGQIRHLRCGEYWNDAQIVNRDKYQNGGYWSMFAGWYWRALAVVDREFAIAESTKFFEHIDRYRFDRENCEESTGQAEHNGDAGECGGIGKCGGVGGPWEWIHPDGSRVGPRYLAGLTLPYRALTRAFDVDADEGIQSP